jgi:hypothetical protein
VVNPDGPHHFANSCGSVSSRNTRSGGAASSQLSSRTNRATDNDWWLEEDDGPTFPPEVLSHLGSHPRRRVTRKSMSDPQPAAAWLSIPSTVVLGRFDDQPGANDLEGAAARVSDTRVLECDHFTLFREPGSVSRAILDGFQAHHASS